MINGEANDIYVMLNNTSISLTDSYRAIQNIKCLDFMIRNTFVSKSMTQII